jgi:hypothetical protein
VEELIATGAMVEKEDGRVGYWSKTTPAKKVSIRNMDTVSYKVIDLKRESTHDDGTKHTRHPVLSDKVSIVSFVPSLSWQKDRIYMSI